MLPDVTLVSLTMSACSSLIVVGGPLIPASEKLFLLYMSSRVWTAMGSAYVLPWYWLLWSAVGTNALVSNPSAFM
jgi:hypothetical protein